jgi:pimeloyl-ACP methyl ester carboxylesterase
MRDGLVNLGATFSDLRLHYTDWGDPSAPRVVVCVHGLTRNARDFDVLASALADAGARVVCVDVAGRGGSDRLPDPGEYRVDVYAAHLARLLEKLGLGRVAWVGTSMGGLIGMTLAAATAEAGAPIERLVLNDVGPFIPKAALEMIGSYLGLDLLFPDAAALEQHLRLIHAPFGPLTDAQWAHLARHSAAASPGGGGVRLHYDPAIRQPFVAGPVEDADLWPVYDAVRCPTLLLRGGESRLLLAETALEMTRRGPKARLVTFPGVGHAPALMAEDQIAAVRDFVLA